MFGRKAKSMPAFLWVVDGQQRTTAMRSGRKPY